MTTVDLTAAEAVGIGAAERLGFSFDQKEHDAAVAAEKLKSAVGAEAGVNTPKDVVRLPRYVVTAARMGLRDDKMLTPEGRIRAAKQRYLNPLYQKSIAYVAAVAALVNNPLGGWQPNTPEAMALYWDDDQKYRNAEMTDLIELTALHRRLTSEPAPGTSPAKK